MQTASRRRRIARGAGRNEVDVTNMIGTFSGMRAKMQSLSKMMKMGGGGGARCPSWHPPIDETAFPRTLLTRGRRYSAAAQTVASGNSGG